MPFYELFASVVVQRKYEDIMNKDNKANLKTRLGTQLSKDIDEEKSNEILREHALEFQH